MEGSKDQATRRRWVRWLWFALLLAVLLAMYMMLGRQTAPVRGGLGGYEAKVPVNVVTVQPGEVSKSLKAIGTVTATGTVVVQARVDGELKSIDFVDGQTVQAGDVLAQIDPRSYQIALDQALGQQMQNAAQLANALRDLKRYETLFKQDSIAQQQVAAQRAQVAQLQGQAKTDQAAVDNARLQLSYTRITAPIDGRLGLRKVDVGNIVHASDTAGLITITRSHPIDVVFAIPQAALLAVLTRQKDTPSLPVKVSGRDGVQPLALGTLIAVDNQIDVATGTVQLKARFENLDDALFPNQFVNVELGLGKAQGLLAPVRALQRGSVGEFVYRVDEQQRVHIVTVSTGDSDGEQTVVLSGLEAGQRVVTEGTDRLREGSQVEVMNQESPS
ncbi:efflux RND transporter periplasmic adaptor subunit [Alcaligenaceae bacterium CGII-47]|nr:efflux RND transporter periplasmic adaptor subunit [Alcaligenaceae bacterium CGII-47]